MESKYVRPQREVPEPLREWMDKDPLVRVCMQMYLSGDRTLEEALLSLAVGQTVRADKLFGTAFRRMQVDPPILRIEIPKEQWEALKAAHTPPISAAATAATESAPPAPGTSSAQASAATESA